MNNRFLNSKGRIHYICWGQISVHEQIPKVQMSSKGI